ncbi:unnamed protein product [Nezara viridula]|uniref:OBP47-like domain-containing protein n=1 Tax=Nezara viridula TaxID=85310 RepID=A0A9P0EBE1_NEZVI|nr:unnamed protein product [Nezara viridula]
MAIQNIYIIISINVGLVDTIRTIVNDSIIEVLRSNFPLHNFLRRQRDGRSLTERNPTSAGYIKPRSLCPSSVASLAMNRTNLLLLVVLVASAVAWPQPPPTPPPPGGEDVPEECRPKPPQHGKDRTTCCDMPHPIAKDSDQFKTIFEECKEQIKSEHPEVMPHHHPHPPPPPPPSAGGAPPPPPPPPHHGGPHLFMTCMDDCVFNKSGLMTDAKLNQEAITKLVDSFAPDSTWKPIALEATKFCYEKSNETKVDDKDGKCNPIPHDFAKCMIKQMYLKCPSEKWQNNDACNDEKKIIEKCPNLMPFPPHPPMKKKE